jgi:hypothetical protein
MPGGAAIALKITVSVVKRSHPLGIERVEFEIEIMLGRFAGVDRAALGFWKHLVESTALPTIPPTGPATLLPSAAPRSIPPKMPWAWAARDQVSRAVTTAIPSFFAEHRGKK